ncbi:hypothetical protein RJ641_027301, partial [Dillenia turbinata]
NRKCAKKELTGKLLKRTVAGVYMGMEYGMERIHEIRDWCRELYCLSSVLNPMLHGALTGDVISAASNKNEDKIVMDAIAGGAILHLRQSF